MMLLAALALSLVHASESVVWDEIPWGETFELRQPLQLEGDARFDEGTRFRFVEAMGLGELGLVLFTLRAESCAFPEMESDVVIVDTEKGGIVGVAMYPECVIDTYVEWREYYEPSFFRLPSSP